MCIDGCVFGADSARVILCLLSINTVVQYIIY